MDDDAFKIVDSQAPTKPADRSTRTFTSKIGYDYSSEARQRHGIQIGSLDSENYHLSITRAAVDLAHELGHAMGFLYV